MERWPALCVLAPARCVAKLVNDEGEKGGGQRRLLVVLGHPFTTTLSPPQLANL